MEIFLDSDFVCGKNSGFNGCEEKTRFSESSSTLSESVVNKTFNVNISLKS